MKVINSILYNFFVVIMFLSVQYNFESNFIKLCPLLFGMFFILTNYTQINFFHFRLLLLPIFIIIFIGKLRSNLLDYSILFRIYDIILVIFYISFTSVRIKSILLSRKKGLESEVMKILIFPFLILFLFSGLSKLINFTPLSFSEITVGKNVLLSYLGFDLQRQTFPFSGGINSFAALSGMLFTISTLTFLMSRKKFFIFSSFVFFAFVLLNDSRGALLFTILSLVLSLILFNFNFRRIIEKIPLIPIFLPFIFFLLLNSSFIIDKLEFIQRNDFELASGNGRLFIWLNCIIDLMNPRIIQLIGYGDFGHFKSEISYSWAVFFGSYDRPELIHPHNTLLMTVYDYGYFGLIIQMFCNFSIIKSSLRIWDTYPIFTVSSIGFMIYFSFIGTTESFFGFYYLNSIYTYIFFVVLHFTIKNLKK